jgi:N-acetylglutamate synthase-like GNAT family acetyltransferase
MAVIRRAQENDLADITRLLDEMDLAHGSISLSNFWIAKEDGEVVGIAHLEPVRRIQYLSSVGVRKDRRGRGIATALIDKILTHAEQDVFLYTVIPEFFERQGFMKTDPPEGDDYRRYFDCSACTPDKCVCMKRSAFTTFQLRRLTART